MTLFSSINSATILANVNHNKSFMARSLTGFAQNV